MERAVQGQRLRGSAGGSTVSAATTAECATACANSDCNVYEFSRFYQPLIKTSTLQNLLETSAQD